MKFGNDTAGSEREHCDSFRRSAVGSRAQSHSPRPKDFQVHSEPVVDEGDNQQSGDRVPTVGSSEAIQATDGGSALE
jgi:hypothetical protein